MYYKFDTDKIDRAKAALLLYGLYRSRGNNSSLNGLETWDRFNSYAKGACLKSSTTAEFVQNFCKKAGIGSIKPVYFSDGNPVSIGDSGELVVSSDIKNYHLEIFSDDRLLRIIENETLYLSMLIRDRIQREKLEGGTDYED